MKGSVASHDHRYSDSVHTNVGARWNAFGSENGIGGKPDSKPRRLTSRSSRHIDPPPRFDLHSSCLCKDGTQVLRWADENLLELTREEIGEYYGRYRLHVPEAERAMARSLERYGQLSPVVVCRRLDRYELIDGSSV